MPKSNNSLNRLESELKSLSLDDAMQLLENHRKDFPSLGVEKLLKQYVNKRESLQKERDRYDAMCIYENNAYATGHHLICGVDEVGRGPLAGPVVAAAVILPPKLFIEKLNDSKKLSPTAREQIFEIILEKAIAWSLGVVDEKKIDDINILNATKQAMQMALDGLSKKPDLVLVDAERFDTGGIKQIPIIRGDTLSVSIAAASIVAKVTRDRMMDEWDAKYPAYGFAKHKGYGTSEHTEAIKKFGLSPIHRVSFTKNFV